jgi:hypothetical protein
MPGVRSSCPGRRTVRNCAEYRGGAVGEEGMDAVPEGRGES